MAELEYGKKELNFPWLLTEFRKGNLNAILHTIKKHEVRNMLVEIEFNATQMSERYFQGGIPKEKFDVIIAEINRIKDLFNKHLTLRLEDGDVYGG
jgi:hypothetical protein